MTQKLVTEILKLLEAPEFLIVVTIFILFAQKQLREHFLVKRVRHTETLSKLVEYMKEYGDKNFFIMEQLFLDHFKAKFQLKVLSFFFLRISPQKIYLIMFREGSLLSFPLIIGMLSFIKKKKEYPAICF